jgi:hypothetical protein
MNLHNDIETFKAAIQETSDSFTRDFYNFEPPRDFEGIKKNASIRARNRRDFKRNYYRLKNLINTFYELKFQYFKNDNYLCKQET